jgi:mono/diheme cytochrome c family protein
LVGEGDPNHVSEKSRSVGVNMRGHEKPRWLQRRRPSPAKVFWFFFSKKRVLLTGLLGLLAAPRSAFAQQDPNPALVGQGKYLAQAGDCTACHTSLGGQAFAGGLAIASPIGMIYSSNITPDKATGIGTWSYDDFARLMRSGKTKEGYIVYPAMPYPSYSRITDPDMHALYAYFMLGVQPVHEPDQRPKIPWPLSMRWPLHFWRWFFAPGPRPFTAAVGQDAQVARGAYLVEGLGHCGACHTPRDITLQEESLTGAHASYLAGGSPIDGWVPVDLRSDDITGLGRWSMQDIVYFLKTGSNDKAAAFGAMGPVVHDSTQYLTDPDLAAIAAYLKSLPGTGGANFLYDNTETTALNTGDESKPGAAVYLAACDVCHSANGEGYREAFPALAGNPVVVAENPDSVINIILDGARRPVTQTSPSALVMPTLAWKLDDQQVADVATFIRSSWGNHAAAVTPDEVARLRKTYKPVPSRELSP